MRDDDTKEEIRKLKELEKQLVVTRDKYDDLSNEIDKKKNEIIAKLAEED